MKKKYYVNRRTQANGDHEVHEEGCKYLPVDRIPLGEFTNCDGAVKESKKHYSQSNGCYYCCKSCHTQ